MGTWSWLLILLMEASGAVDKRYLTDLYDKVSKFIQFVLDRLRRENATPSPRRRGVCAVHSFIERLRWTNASVKALLKHLKTFVI